MTAPQSDRCGQVVEAHLVEGEQHLDPRMGPLAQPREDRQRAAVVDVEHRRHVVVPGHRHRVGLLARDGRHHPGSQLGVEQGVDRPGGAVVVGEGAEHDLLGAPQGVDLGPLGVQAEHEVGHPAAGPGDDVEQTGPARLEHLDLDDLDRTGRDLAPPAGQPAADQRLEGGSPVVGQIEHRRRHGF